MEPERNSRTLLMTVVGIALLAVLGGVIWYSTGQRSGSDEITNATSTDEEVAGVMRNANIVVNRPRANERIGMPLVIEGEARVFENTVHFRLLDESGSEIAKGFATADARDVGQFGAFRGELNFVSETDQAGTLEIFQISAEDGSEIDKLSIPVVITTTPEFIKG